MIKKTIAVISIVMWLIMVLTQISMIGDPLGNGIVSTPTIALGASMISGVVLFVFYVICGAIPQAILDRLNRDE